MSLASLDNQNRTSISFNYRGFYMTDDYQSNDAIAEQITWVITELWIIKGRQDLLDDCFAFVTDLVMSLDKPIMDADIIRAFCMFLQEHCKDAISSKDLDDMNKDVTKH